MSQRSLGMSVAFAAMLMAGTALAQEKVVHVYNWSDYINESILTDFSLDTGM